MIRQQRVQWQAEVSTRYLPRISEGLSVEIDGPDDHPIQGEVRLVGPSVNTNTGRAIVFRDGLNYVFTVDADKRARRVRVETGRNNGEVEIISGIDRSSRVVTSAGAFPAWRSRTSPIWISRPSA